MTKCIYYYIIIYFSDPVNSAFGSRNAGIARLIGNLRFIKTAMAIRQMSFSVRCGAQIAGAHCRSVQALARPDIEEVTVVGMDIDRDVVADFGLEKLVGAYRSDRPAETQRYLCGIA